MAYNFYQNQKQVSFGLQSQIANLQESIEQQGKEELIQRQSQIQEQDIESTEEQSQLKQLQASGVASIVEGSVLGIPAVKNITGLVKQGVSAYQKGSEALENLKSTATEAISNIKQSATKITSNLSNITDDITSNLKGAVLENPLTAGLTSSSSFDTPISIFQKQPTSVLTDTEKAIQEQTKALNQYRTPAPEQFGEDINMEGRQLSNIPTAVLPTDKPIAETSFGLETPSINPISGNKSVMASVNEITPITPISEATEATETVASTVEKKSRGILGTIFGDIGEGIADILDPIADIATAGIAIYSTVKGIEDETAKPEKMQTQTPTLQQEQIPTEIQSQAQVGI